MTIDITSFVGLAGIPVVQALTGLVKTILPTVPDKYTPAVALFWGIALNEGLAYLLATDLKTAAIVGVITGLASIGLYDYAKAKAATIY